MIDGNGEYGICRNGHPYSLRPCGKRVCKTCVSDRLRRQRELPGTRAKLSTRMQRWRARNPEKARVAYSRLRAQNIKWTRQVKVTRGCRSCGEKHPACLEFHHRDQATKDALIAKVTAHWSRERLMREIEKCDVLCSNCHRKLHWDEGTAYRKRIA